MENINRLSRTVDLRCNVMTVTVREKSKKRMLQHYKWYQEKKKNSKRSERIRRKLKLPPGDLRIVINEVKAERRKAPNRNISLKHSKCNGYDDYCDKLWKMSGKDRSLSHPFVDKSLDKESMFSNLTKNFTVNADLEIKIKNDTTSRGTVLKTDLFSRSELQKLIKLEEETLINICYLQPSNDEDKGVGELKDSLRNETEVDGSVKDTLVGLNQNSSTHCSFNIEKEVLYKTEEKLPLTVSEEDELYKFLQNIRIESDDESFDELAGKKHPNRRLQLERKRLNDEQKPCMPKVAVAQPEVVTKTSEMWIDVIKTPDLWRKEKAAYGGSYTNLALLAEKFKQEHVDCTGVLDYNEMLLDFIDSKLMKYDGKTPYERRYEQEFSSCKSNTMFFKNFYIPPAQVEVFHKQLTDQLTAIECLRQVCLARRWPQPSYQPVSHSSSHLPKRRKSSVPEFSYRVCLRGVCISPTETAVGESLARELAASTALHWLGLEQRPTNTAHISKWPQITSYFGPNH